MIVRVTISSGKKAMTPKQKNVISLSLVRPARPTPSAARAGEAVAKANARATVARKSVRRARLTFRANLPQGRAVTCDIEVKKSRAPGAGHGRAADERGIS